jgi:CRP/FNR family transcriptional regulator
LIKIKCSVDFRLCGNLKRHFSGGWCEVFRRSLSLIQIKSAKSADCTLLKPPLRETRGFKMGIGSNRSGGPPIHVVDPLVLGNPSIHQLLSSDERARSIVRFKKGERIFSEGEPRKMIFNIISGVAKAYNTSKKGSEHIAAFLYPEDMLGLSEGGKYTNSAKALTSVTAYALPAQAFQRLLSKDADLDIQVITKLARRLRQAQRHALLLARRHSSSRLATFLQLQEQIQSRAAPATEIYLPMDRSDIANYVGMSLSAVSRGFRALAEAGVHVKIIDRRTFENLAHEQDTSTTTTRSAV